MSLQRKLLTGLIVTHRWLAIFTCLLFVMWFLSGLVMMYVGFPNLSAAEKSRGLDRIRWEKVQIAPDQALAIAGVAKFPRELRLEMMADEPVYRVRSHGAVPLTISAVDGRVINQVDALQAVRIASEFADATEARLVETLERDQWTVAGTFTGHRPLHRVAIDDAAGTELYVSSTNGEVMLDTTRRERVWNWFGSVIHWIYFTELRANPPLWRQVVLWTSGVGIFVAISGLWLGIDRLRVLRRYPGRRVTPYRGWMAWHHIAGVVGGIFLLTWIFSGWMSMGPPVPWQSDFNARAAEEGLAAYRGNVEPRTGATLETLNALQGRVANTATFTWLAGQPLIVLNNSERHATVVDASTGMKLHLADEMILAAARQLVPGAQPVSHVRLNEEDAYWYSHHNERKLPVLRVMFDDPDQTWAYIDPDTGAVLARIRASDRIHRWVFSALHSLDFRWLLAHRPAWDAVMWTLSLAGLVISVSGVVIGWRRLRR